METLDTNKYPAMSKAISDSNLSKSLEFTKKGSEVYEGVMAKLGTCQGELIRMLSKWKERAKADDTDNEITPNAKDEPWEIRSKRREIDKLQRIARNLDKKKSYKLSEYDLQEYGL